MVKVEKAGFEANNVKTKQLTKAPSNRSWWVSVIVMSVVVLIGLVLILHWHQQNTAEQESHICTSKTYVGTLEQAALAIVKNNIIEQRTAITKIKTIPNFQKDPDCLYPVALYYIDTGDVNNSTTYFNELKAVYSAKREFSPILGNTVSMSTLNSEVSYLKKNTQLPNDNVYGFGASGSKIL